MNVNILGKYELRPMDALNWQLWKLSKDKDGNPKWVPMGRYYQSFAQALKHVYESELRFADGDGGLMNAIERAEAIERRIEAAAIILEEGVR